MLSLERGNPVYHRVPVGLITMVIWPTLKILPLMYLLDRFLLFLHVFEMLHHINTIDPRGALHKEYI